MLHIPNKMLAPTTDQPLHLVVRFASDAPDLPLTIPHPPSTTVLALKHKIRPHLPSSLRQNNLRLIHTGKLLPDTATLSSCLKLSAPPPPPSRNVGEPDGTGLSEKAKGKLPDREGNSKDAASNETGYARAWIHCSISDNPLSAAALAAEEAAASAFDNPSVSSSVTSRQYADPSASPTTELPEQGTTTPPPQGFDRLLGAGFTAADIAQLREQLRHELSFTHTPDTMPTGAELLVYEERWLDSSAAPDSGPLVRNGTSANDNRASRGWLSLSGILRGGNGGTGTGGIDFNEEEAGYDDNLYGSLTGFIWPMGSFMFGYREEGVWTRRRWLAVMAGIAGNLVIGFLKMSG